MYYGCIMELIMVLYTCSAILIWLAICLEKDIGISA